MNEPLSDEQKRWIEDYCNGTISPEEFASFEKALESSAELRALTRRYLAMDSHLYRGAEQTILLEEAWTGAAPTSAEKVIRYSWLPWAAAAGIVFLMGMGLGGFLNPGGNDLFQLVEQEDDGIAVLKHAADAVWADDSDESLATGSILSPGRLRLESGLAQIEFYNGARLILDGPVDLELVSVDRAICYRGKMRALIPPNARGFTVLSSQFELVDLGTEFGIEVGSTGDAKVQVFDGEVELYPPDGKRAPDQLTRLLGGFGLSWTSAGETTSIASEPESFPSFEDVESRNQLVTQRRFENWNAWNEKALTDPRMVVHYDFESEGNRLLDRGPGYQHGTIVGSEWSEGRWPEKSALEFKRPGDRVRIDVPGEFDAATFAAWVRVDALPARRQALLLTDEYQIGRVHWQIGPEGELRFGMRVNRNAADGVISSGYASPVLFSPRRIGMWNFVCSSYDRKAGVVRHFFNGRQVSQHEIVSDQPLQIGPGDIGNWSMPLKNQKRTSPVRNFIGRIDGMTIWNEALSGKEILNIFKQTRP